jgi:DNA-binding IclR family transcriptional regulator
MEQIRKQGFALNLGEWREGVWGVAALIRDARGEVAGAVGISGPSFRIKERNIDNYVGPVMAAAEDISSRLGYRKNLLVRST